MKLVLMALAVEISLARVFVSSWVWAVGIVLLYCIFVYVRQTILMKKRGKNKSDSEFENIMIQGYINGNRKKQNEFYDMRPL